jgi:hypothetical protein
MRIDSFFFSFIFLVLSLLVLLFSNMPQLCDIAYISTLLSIALFTIDDWLDIAFMKVLRFLFMFSGISAITGRKLQRTNPVGHLFFMRQTRTHKSRRRWSYQHPAGRVRRISYR